MSFKTPILFTIFNRPNETAKVFAEIRNIKPKFLFISADGPRNEEERNLCEVTRNIVNNIDWDCTVKIKFENKNLGCKIAMSSAITWFFQNVEQGIILEDDCLPHPDFFRFCEALLERYKNTTNIMMISGDNFQDGIKRGEASYYFSKFIHIWGWASWRRSWGKYDIEMQDLKDFIKTNPFRIRTRNQKAIKILTDKLWSVYRGEVDTWDFQWIYSVLKNDGLCIVPNTNLVSNIGWGDTATHTKKESNNKSNLKTHGMENIIHPKIITQDKEADEYSANKFYPQSWIDKIKNILKW